MRIATDNATLSVISDGGPRIRAVTPPRTDAGGPRIGLTILLPVSQDRGPPAFDLSARLDPFGVRTHPSDMTRRPMIGVGAVVVAVVITVGIALGASSGGPKPGPSSDPSAPVASGSVASVPTPRPIPGHEVFGFVPYWEMNGDIAAHVAADRPDDARPLLRDPHEERRDRHEADRLQADHRRHREPAHPRSPRPRDPCPVRLFQLRDGPQPDPVHVAQDPGRDDRGPRRARRNRSASTASTSMSSSSGPSSSRPTVRSSVGCARRSGPRSRMRRSRSPRPRD